MDVHRGMPLVAVGLDAPASERSIYATHPAGLVWVLAATFAAIGESEAAARLTAVGASLLTLALWVRIVCRAGGREVAMLCGLFYSIMPMSVYFGRMVNHEAYCLLGMVLALSCWQDMVARGRSARHRWIVVAGCLAGLCLSMVIDWIGVLYAGLFCLHVARRRREVGDGVVAVTWAVSGLCVAGIMTHIVYGGLDGRWANLVAIFTSRSATLEPGGASLFWHNTVDNLTLPVMALAAVGLPANGLVHRRTRPAGGSVTDEASSGGMDGGWILVVSGLGWLLIFRRQYQIHQYWLFYLGPMIALWSARGVLTIRDALRGFGAVVSHGLACAAVLIALLACQRGVDDFFARRQCPMEFIEACRAMRAATVPDERVVLQGDPIVTEQFGSYVFRNITPPQLAYYLDRPFDVQRDGNSADSGTTGGR